MQEVGVPIVLYALEEHAVVIKVKTRIKVVFILVLAPLTSVLLVGWILAMCNFERYRF